MPLLRETGVLPYILILSAYAILRLPVGLVVTGCRWSDLPRHLRFVLVRGVATWFFPFLAYVVVRSTGGGGHSPAGISALNLLGVICAFAFILSLELRLLGHRRRPIGLAPDGVLIAVAFILAYLTPLA